MVENPVPSPVDVLLSILVILGVPAAIVVPIIVVFAIADWVRFAASTAEFTRDLAGRVRSGSRWLDRQRWGQWATLAIAQVVLIASVYSATRWIMGLPRIVWPGVDLSPWERLGYAFSPPESVQEPELVVALIALGFTIAVEIALVFRNKASRSIAEFVTGFSGWIMFVVGAGAIVVGIIGALFYTAVIGAAERSISPYAADRARLQNAILARDGAFEIVFLGIALCAVWGASVWFINRSEVASGDDDRWWP